MPLVYWRKGAGATECRLEKLEKAKERNRLPESFQKEHRPASAGKLVLDLSPPERKRRNSC